MAALSALVFSLSWWLGLYLLARDPRKPVLVLAVDRPDELRGGGGAGRGADGQRPTDVLSRVEIYLVAVPGIAWFAVLLELSRPRDSWRSRAGESAFWSPWPRSSRSSARRWPAVSKDRCGWATG